MQSLQVRGATVDPEIDDVPDSIPLQEYWRILKRRKAIIIQAFIVIAVIGTVVTLLTKPVYQSSARLLVDGQSLSINTVDDSNPLSGILALSQEQDVATQVEELQAGPLLNEVYKKSGPATLSVAEVNGTDVIEVTSESNKPQVAADAANMLLQTYINEDVDRNLVEIRSAEAFAQKKEIDARRRLAESEAKIRAFKEHTRVPDVTQGLTAQLGLTDGLTQKVLTDESTLQALRSQILVEQQILVSEPKSLSVSLPGTNPMIGEIQNELATLKLQRISLTQKGGFTASAPQIVAIDAQILALNHELRTLSPTTSTISSSPNATREGLRSNIETLEGQAASESGQLESDKQGLANAQTNAGKYPRWQVTLDDLTREHDSAESEDKMFSDKIADLSLREQAHHATAQILEYAQVPSVPVKPKRVTSILFACLVGLFVGVVLAVLAEFLDDRINTADEASRFLGASSLGLIPTIEEGEPHLLPEMKGLASAAESYRMLRTNIHFAAVDSPVKTMLITSAGPSEGKTTTATNIAFAMALDGRKVVLVDTDLRRPSLHKILKLPVAPGLTDVLLGHANLDETLQPNADFANLSVLCSGSTPPNPGELLNSRKFRSLVEELKEFADVVIFDSAPVLVAADSAILASQVDGTLFVVESGGTKKTSAKRALQILHQARAAVLGVVYNKMSLRDDGDGYYYYRYNYHTMLPEGQNGSLNGSIPKSTKKLGSDSAATATIDEEHSGN